MVSEKVAGQFRFDDCAIDLGVADLSIAQATVQGIKSIVIGVAPTGGKISQRWVRVLVEAADAGLDVVSGLHRPTGGVSRACDGGQTVRCPSG